MTKNSQYLLPIVKKSRSGFKSNDSNQCWTTFLFLRPALTVIA